MQEKKNKRLFISLVGLIILTGIVFWRTGKGKSDTLDKNIFRVEDFKTINKVLLESQNRKIELAFIDSRWKVNERYDADRNMVTLLFATLLRAEPKRPVSKAIQDSLNSELKKNGTKVSLFEGNIPIKEFYAGGNIEKTQAYFLEPQTNKAFLMTIPGYRVYVSGILELNENGWRDKYLFGFNWRNFQSLLAEFPDNPAENFKVATDRNFFGIEGMAEADTAKLNTFLDQVSLLTVDEYADSSSFTDSLSQLKPKMILTISDIADRKYILKLFQPLGNRVSGIIQGDQVVYFNSQKIQPIIRPKSFFKKQ